MRGAVLCLVFAVGFLLSFPVQAAQGARAAAMEIVHGTIEMRRVNTTAWLPLSAGTLQPITEGDGIRTDAESRVYITLLDSVEFLLLPRTSLEIVTFETNAAEQINLHLTITGTAIFRTLKPENFSAFTLNAGALTLDSPAGNFAIRSVPDFPPALLVSEGSAAGSLADQPFTLAAGYGLYGEATPVQIARPTNFAQLDARLNGCPGRVNTINAVGLRVRVGATTLYYALGVLANDSQVMLLGATEDNRWLRVQFLSGYGWVERLALITACDDLPTFPNEYFEYPIRVPNLQPFEVALLEPYYGRPEDDPWFFQDIS